MSPSINFFYVKLFVLHLWNVKDFTGGIIDLREDVGVKSEVVHQNFFEHETTIHEIWTNGKCM